MPGAKRTASGSLPDWNTFWRSWGRVARNGISANGKRYSLPHVLQAWALVLAVLYLMLLWASRSASEDTLGAILSEEVAMTDAEFFQNRHLIFCVSPGRSGSAYLRNVLNVAEGIIARHEPEPKMNGPILEQVIIEGRRKDTFRKRSALKLSSIREALEGTPQDVVYAETSHMFVKTFADVVLDEIGDLAKISILFLRRPTKDTVWSQLQLGWFSKGHSGKNLWYYNPNDVHKSEMQIPLTFNASDAVESLIGYNADVQQRGSELEQKIRRMHKQKKWRHVHMREVLLMDISGASVESGTLKLLSSLGLKVERSKLNMLSEQDTNARDAKKERRHVETTKDDIEHHLVAMKRQHSLLREVLY